MLSVLALIESKMRSLRSEMAAKLRDMKKPSGSEGGKQRRPWRFFESLLFLKPSIVPRGNVSNLSTDLDDLSENLPEVMTALSIVFQ